MGACASRARPCYPSRKATWSASRTPVRAAMIAVVAGAAVRGAIAAIVPAAEGCMQLVLQIHRLRPEAAEPRYASDGAAGLDLSAALAQPITLQPGERTAVPTGWALALPRGHEGQVRPRSGLALKRGLTVVNAPGTIDEDYRGELAVLLV